MSTVVGDVTQNSASQFFTNQAPTSAGPGDMSQGSQSQPSTIFDSSDGGTLKTGPDDSGSSFSAPQQPVATPSQQPFVPQQPSPSPQQPSQPSSTPFQDAAMQQSQQAQQAAWAQRLAQAGYQPPQTPEELANAYLSAQQQMAQMQTYAQYGQQFLPHAQQFMEFLRHQSGAQSSPQTGANVAETPSKPKSVEEVLHDHWSKMWKAPEYDPAWESLVKLNPETQLYEGINPFVPANVVQGMNSYREWKRKSLNDLIDKPFELTWKAISPGIEEVVKQQIQNELQSHRINSEFDAIEDQYASVLYEHDQSGNRVVDPFTGGYKWTPFGQHVADEMRRLSQAGMKDPFVTFEYAVNSAKAMIFDRQMKSGQQNQQPQYQQPQQLQPLQPIQQPWQGQQLMAPGYGFQQPMQPQLPASAQRFGIGPQQPQPLPMQPQLQQPYSSPQMPVPSMYAPAVSAGHSVFGGYQAGMNGQLPVGGGVLPQPMSFLDHARMAHAGHTAPAVSPSGESDYSEDFFSREASRLGFIRAA